MAATSTSTSSTVTAKLRYLKIAPRKVRAVVDLIRGLSVNEAEARLMLSPRRSGSYIRKLLRSAVANAKQTLKVDPMKLFVCEVRVDQGPKTTRWTPRARGSASPIEKKTSHITLVLGVSDTLPKPRFTFAEKPKKEKPDERKKRGVVKSEGKESAKKPHEVATAHSREEKKVAPGEKPKSGRGFMQKMFRRKAI